MLPTDESQYRTYCYECEEHHQGECQDDSGAYDEYDILRELRDFPDE